MTTERCAEIAGCAEHHWTPSTVPGYAYCTRCSATTQHHTPDPRRNPVDVIDRIDELVNDSLQHP